jgi:Domain of unknown function (DUF3854)
MNPTLALLLSDLYDGALAPAHRADLEQRGLTAETIRQQRIMSVPPDLIDRLLGFPTPKVVSAYLIPFPDPRGGWMDHVRLRVFPPVIDAHGHPVKYLQPKRSGVRCYFPLAALAAVRHSPDPLYLVEGEKNALAVAQAGDAAIGLCGIEGWHVNRSAALHPDLDDVGFDGRVVHVLPDADHPPPPAVAHILRGLAEACTARGASEVLVHIASEVLRYTPACDPGIDDDLVRP